MLKFMAVIPGGDDRLHRTDPVIQFFRTQGSMHLYNNTLAVHVHGRPDTGIKKFEFFLIDIFGRR